jgi:hypothetical protein
VHVVFGRGESAVIGDLDLPPLLSRSCGHSISSLSQ